MKTKFAFIMTTGLAVVAFSAPANAQGVPVIDPGNIAQTVKVVQNGIQQVQQLKQQVTQMTQMATTIGTTGPSALIGQALKSTGLDFSNPALSPVAQYRAAMPGIIDGLPGSDVGKALNIPTSLAQQAKTSLQSARQFALQVFYKPGNATVDDVANRQGVRQAAMRDSVTSGYGMAVFTKNDLAKTEERMKALSQGVTKAVDLRGDVQSNSAIAMAQLQQLTVQNQLLAQLLEVQSTAAMAGDSSSPIQH